MDPRRRGAGGTLVDDGCGDGPSLSLAPRGAAYPRPWPITTQREAMLDPFPEPSGVPRPWCDRYPPGVPPRVEPPRTPLTALLDRSVRDHPTRPALATTHRSWPWWRLQELVDRGAVRLADLGVGVGDRVVVVSPPRPAAVVAVLACWRLGAVAVPVDPAEGDALASRLPAAAPTAVVADVAALDAMEDVRPALPGCRAVLVTDPTRWSTPGRRLVATGAALLGLRRTVARDDDVLDFDDVLEAGDDVVAQADVGPDDPALVLPVTVDPADRDPARYGGVALTHGQLGAAGTQLREWVVDARDGREAVLLGLPLDAPAGMSTIVMTMLLAATVVLPDSRRPGRLLDAVERHAATVAVAAPAVLDRLAGRRDVAGRDLGSLHVVLAAGPELPGPVRRRIARSVPDTLVRHLHGPTEAGGVLLGAPLYGERDQAVVLPVSGTVVCVVDVADPTTVVATGQVGRLLVAGPQVADVDGWLVTDELAVLEDRGTLRLLGRVDHLIRRGGALVAPVVVEQALETHPAVERARVVGDPGPGGTARTGDDRELVAEVVPVRRRRPSGRRLLAHVTPLLVEAAVPDRVVVRRSLSWTHGGRPDRSGATSSPAGTTGGPTTPATPAAAGTTPTTAATATADVPAAAADPDVDQRREEVGT